MSDTTTPPTFGPTASGALTASDSDIRILPAARLSPAQLEAARKVLQHIRPAGGPAPAGSSPAAASAAR